MPKSKTYKLDAEPADLPPEADQAHRFEKARSAQATALLVNKLNLVLANNAILGVTMQNLEGQVQAPLTILPSGDDTALAGAVAVPGAPRWFPGAGARRRHVGRPLRHPRRPAFRARRL